MVRSYRPESVNQQPRGRHRTRTNPLVWMAEINGLLVDLRDMPREVQEIAFEKGMIPYIPADRE
jgi:hypothetical protein